MAYLGGGDIGCSSTRIEEGSTASPAARSARDRSRALHSALLGPCCSEKQFPELLPSTEAMRHQAHGPRLERGDAPARGTRRGSTEGMAPWRHLTAGVKPGRARPGRGRSPLSHQTGRTRKGWRHPKRENEVARSPVSSGRVQIRPGDTGCASSEWARPATVVLVSNRQEIHPPRETAGGGERGPRREPRAEEDSRLAGVPARRTCVAEIGSAIAAQRSPFETSTTGFRSARGSPAPAACESRIGQQTGRRGLRSRVNLSDGIARCPARALSTT